MGANGVEFSAACEDGARITPGTAMARKLLATAFSVLIAGTAAAQTPPAANTPNASQLSEVVVTAQKRSQRLLTVPAAVTALSAADLARTEAVQLQDFTAQTPGLNLISDREGETQIIIRGITTGTPVNSTVATYIDDTPYGSSTNEALGGELSPDLDPSDIQRIEVLRGPQGTLYGASSLGGLIKYVTTPPNLTTYQARIEADGSSVDGGGQGYGVRVMANLPIVNDMLGVRLSGYDRRDPGYINDPQLGERNLNDTLLDGGRASLLFRPTPEFSLNLTTVLQDLEGKGSSDEDVNVNGTTLSPSTGDLEQIRYTHEPLDVRYRLYSATMNYDLEWANIVSVTSYSTQHETATVDLTDALGTLLSDIFRVPHLGFDVGSELYLHKTTQELRLESPSNLKLEWRVGFYFTHEQSFRFEPSTIFSTETGQVVPLPSIFFSDLDSRYTEYAGFGDLTYHFTPRLDLTAGVRYSTNTQNFTNLAGGLAAGGTSTITQNSSDDSTTFLVSPRFRIDPDNMVYARIASGYRPGGPNATTLSDAAAGVPLTYRPDTLTDYDIGYKASLFQHKLDLDIAAFHIDWQNIQIESDFDGITASGNGGSARSDGIEASAALMPLRGLNIRANATYTDAHLTEDARGVNGVDGDELPNVPKWAVGATVDYDRPLTDNVAGFVGGGLHFVGDRVSGFVTGSPAGFVRPPLPSYTTVDLRTGVNYRQYTFEFYIKNVGDTRGFNNITSLANSGYQAPFTASVIPPRTFGLSVIARY